MKIKLILSNESTFIVPKDKMPQYVENIYKVLGMQGRNLNQNDFIQLRELFDFLQSEGDWPMLLSVISRLAIEPNY